MPPRMFPIAIPRSCDNAALTVIAISGRFVAIGQVTAPDRLAEARGGVEHVGRVGEVDACDPDGARRDDEYEHEKRERHAAVAFAP